MIQWEGARKAAKGEGEGGVAFTCVGVKKFSVP